jgi:hypothetical protein
MHCSGIKMPWVTAPAWGCRNLFIVPGFYCIVYNYKKNKRIEPLIFFAWMTVTDHCIKKSIAEQNIRIMWWNTGYITETGPAQWAMAKGLDQPSGR